MSPTHFSHEQWGTCANGCGRPATHRIVGHPGNVDWSKVCKTCVDAWLRKLEMSHSATSDRKGLR